MTAQGWPEACKANNRDGNNQKRTQNKQNKKLRIRFGKQPKTKIYGAKNGLVKLRSDTLPFPFTAAKAPPVE